MNEVDRDLELVASFSERRDEASFRQLYRRHTPMLFGLAVRLCRSRDEAEELTQATWVRAVEHHDTFGGRSRYSTWLAGILVNCYREAARRHTRRPMQLIDDQEPAAAAASLGVRRRSPASSIDLERALGRLSTGYREVVILHDIYGFTHREIGAALGIQEGSSKSQLKRGRERLRELLGKESSSSDRRGRKGES